MTTQWGPHLYVSGNQGPKFGRVVQILVGKNGNGDVNPTTGLFIANVMPDGSPGLRISFEIQKTIYKTPNTALVKIYNMNESHEKLVDKEFNDTIIQCGYRGQAAECFRGNIRFTHHYREGNERVVEINAGDGDKDYRGAMVNFTLNAGHTDEQVIRHVVRNFQATTLGHVHGKHLKREHIRGRTYLGNARDVLNPIERENDGNWSIQDGKLQLVPCDSVTPAEAIAVSSEMGMLGAPEVNDKGITIEMMLDPRILPGGKLWLQNNEVKQKHLKPAIEGQKHKLHGPNLPVRTDPDGVYKVYAVKHTGDTRDQVFKSECRCVALDSPIPSRKGMPISSTPDGDVM